MKKFSQQLLALLGIAFLLTLFGPSLVILNAPDQEVPLDVWLYLTLIFIGTSLALGLALLLLNKWFKIDFLTLIKSLYLTIFIKIIYDYYDIKGVIGIEDGAPKVNIFTLGAQIESAIFFILLTFIFFILSKKYISITNQLYFSSITISILAPAYIFISYQYIEGKNNNQNYKFNYSTNKNVIIILADMLQGSTSNEFFKKNPKTFDQLNGFTVYPNAVSPFPFTNFSLPALLAGKTYARSYNDNFKDNLLYAQQNSFITDAFTKGFEPQVVGLKNLQLYSNQKNLYYGFSGKDLSLSLINSTLKRIFKLNFEFKSLSENQQLIGLKKLSLEIMNSMGAGNLIESKPIITVVHNFIPHTPIYFPKSEEINEVSTSTEKEFNPTNYYSELNFFYQELNKLFVSLKKNGVYDNSLIIVVGDHGHFISRELSLYKFPMKKNELPGYETGPWERTIAMYNPLIMVKPPLANSKPIISSFGMNITNIKDLVNQFINGQNILLDNYLKDNQEIIVFNNFKKNPYFFTDDHKIIKFSGNINNLLYKYTTPLNLSEYIVGDILLPANNVLFGKWVKEKNGAWLQEQRARAVFKIKEPQKFKDLFLSLNITPLISDIYKFQDVELMINGKSIGIYRFNHSEQSIKIKIPHYIYKDDDGIFRVEFMPINPASPKSIGLWDENYLLSIFIHTLSLSEE